MSGRILWRFAARSELRAECTDVTAWLSAGENARRAQIRNAGRREAFVLGRVALKQLLLAECRVHGSDPQALEIVSQDALGRKVRPQAILAGRTLPWSVSISHTETAVLVALATEPGVTVGGDLVAPDATAVRFLRSWFDPSEQKLVARADAAEACRLWAIKEAVYKATNQDDSFLPRRVAIRRTPSDAYQATYRGRDLAPRCHIATWDLPGHVAALAQVIGRGGAFAPLVEQVSPTLAPSS